MSSGQQTGYISMRRANPGSRFLIWIDGVGGYLVCLEREVSLGQALPESGVDIPVLGDLSRRHLKLYRGDEVDMLEPFGQVHREGVELAGRSTLQHGDELTLGRGVRLRYSRSHPLSDTSRLDFCSRHRTSPWTDGVLLMGSTLMLGPRLSHHVVCPEWSDELLLFRKGQQLLVRGPEKFFVDGKRVSSATALGNQSRIEGDDFAFSLEPL